VTKEDLLKKVAQETGLTIKASNEAIQSFSKNIIAGLKKGESIRLNELGTFSVSKRGARIGRNPQSGKELNIPAKNVVRFKAAKFVREEIAKSK